MRDSVAGSPTAIRHAQASSGGWMLDVIVASELSTLYVWRRTPDSGVFQKIVWPMKPSADAAASSDSSSSRARSGRSRRHATAVKQESQYHCHG